MGVGKSAAEKTTCRKRSFCQPMQSVELTTDPAIEMAYSTRNTFSPKKSYRSAYAYPWHLDLADLAQVLTWKNLSNFDLLLRLVDFSGLRPVLAHLLGWQSGRGREPFDPVSFFLLVTYPPPECPYQADEHQHGRVINVGETFADASTRLVRDVPIGSPTWKALYPRLLMT
jgi:hypothetical protein